MRALSLSDMFSWGFTPAWLLGEEHGVGHLSYVMIECSRAHEKAVGAYLAGYFGSQIAHGYGVLEGAGGCRAEVVWQSALVFDSSKSMTLDVNPNVFSMMNISG